MEKNGDFLKNIDAKHRIIQKHDRAQAEALAIRALGHIANDDKLMSRFFALTGLDPENLRAAAADPAFLSEILEFLAGHEADCADFTRTQNISPEEWFQARAALKA